MNKVTFTKYGTNTSYDSYSNLSLILNSKEIEAPSPKTATIDIPGGDGELDFTEYFGEVKYKNRKITLNFTSLAERVNFLTHFSTLQNLLHGRKFKITFSDDPNFYYVGRIAIDKWTANKSLRTFTATVNCEPYKYKQVYTYVQSAIPVGGAISASYLNLQKSVVPKITLEYPAKITFGSQTYSLSAGAYVLPGIVFVKGTNTIIVTEGTKGTHFTVEYQEGEL